MKFFPDRLKSARKMNSFSLQDLSDRLNNTISKQDLNRLELGTIQPDSRMLVELSNVLKVSIDYFLKENTISLENVEFRKLTKLPKKYQEAVKSKTQEYLERYIELENLMGEICNPPFQFQEYKINSESDIENAAMSFRNTLNIGDDPIFNINELIEEHGIKVFKTLELPSFSGMSAYINNSIMVLVYNDMPTISLVRKRFTILHEVAHLYLDLSKFDEKTSEKLCDKFASAVLLPEIHLRKYFGGKRETVYIKELESIKSYFGISLSAIMYRAKDLGLISEHYCKYFFIKYNQLYKNKEIYGYEGIENSDRFIQMIMRGIAQEVISTTKGASLYNLKLGDFREKYLDSVTA